MRWSRRRIAAAAAAVGSAAGLLTGFLAALSLTGASAMATQPPAAAPCIGLPARSPFTGERVNSPSRVLAMKIDNIRYARPQTGLSQADIVYALPVEGGLSRLLAIYSSHLPPVVGPVRSAREDDLALLRQFGRPAFAYSGATPALLPYIHRYGHVVDLNAGTASGYFRDNRRSAPYNLYAHTRQLTAQAGQASTAHGIGFRFGPAPAGGQAAASESVSYPAASFTFTWSRAERRWLVAMDGKAARTTGAGQLSAATVVIQHTRVTTSRFLEYGKRPPYAVSTGSGAATVLRDGMAYQARWSRPDTDDGTTFTTASGQPMTFAPGPVWIILAYK